jgi:hypothetical protein
MEKFRFTFRRKSTGSPSEGIRLKSSTADLSHRK